MSDDPKKGEDLTRIEDLSEYLHEADEDDDFHGLNTDPDLTLPDDFNATDEADYSALEEDLDNVEPDSISDNFDDDEGSSDSFEDDFSDNSFEDSSLEADSFDNDDDDDNNENSFEDPSFEDNSFEDSSFEDDTLEEETIEDSPTNDFDSDSDSLETSQLDDFPTDSDPEESDNTAEDLTDDFVEEQEEIDESFEKVDEPPLSEKPTIVEPIQPQALNTEYKAPENFQDLQRFAKNMSYGNLSHEGNPPFSIILKDIKYQEDLDDIVILLKEFKILSAEDETSARQTLSRGSFLIPRLSEYAAILLCHKFRRFELTILMGLTEEINPAKTYSSDDSGMATKHNIFNNRSHNFTFDNESVSLEDIVTSTSHNLEGYEIKEYLGVVTDHSIVTSEELTSEDSGISDHLYEDLVSKLKYSAINKKGNGVVAINYTMIPLLKESAADKNQYKIICTGNVVWLIKK